MARIKPQALLIQSKKKKGPTRIRVTTILLCNLIVLLILFSLIDTYRNWSQRFAIPILYTMPILIHAKLSLQINLLENVFIVNCRTREQTGIGLSTFEHVDKVVDSNKYDIPGYADLNTSKGYITLELFKDSSPETVDKFLDLCSFRSFMKPSSTKSAVVLGESYNFSCWTTDRPFKGMPFHQVIKNYVILGGHSKGLGGIEDWTSKGKPHSRLTTRSSGMYFFLVFCCHSDNLKSFLITNQTKTWSLYACTTKVEEDSKAFQLFITTAPIPDLNEKLLVFGRVIKGEDVVQEIKEVDTDEHYRPKSPVVIIDVMPQRGNLRVFFS
ncbi:peptidyl-prolyl cis-trans isomerase CYP21-4-like [Durio zibethinus]|uniref:Peptidyl-prolyl cis-trans isomerase CYP21-4-like n=1 Tax=Durio zibethinus TaxID=66656 RepID=A0A6P5X1R3_DURZI|nr:peptidyl-prolyl cis-trans isomerase CYP21-4-like [Durio zibethinus]